MKNKHNYRCGQTHRTEPAATNECYCCSRSAATTKPTIRSPRPESKRSTKHEMPWWGRQVVGVGVDRGRYVKAMGERTTSFPCQEEKEEIGIDGSSEESVRTLSTGRWCCLAAFCLGNEVLSFPAQPEMSGPHTDHHCPACLPTPV